jgi:serine protease
MTVRSASASRPWTFPLLPLLAACSMASPRSATTQAPFEVDSLPAGHSPGTLVVDLVDGTSLDDARHATGLDLRWVAPQTEDEALAEVEVADLLDAQAAIESLPLVEVAEPSMEVEAYGFPNDPMFDAQWNFRIVGAPRGWRMGGGRGVTVAVVDTGVTRVADLEGTTVLPGVSFTGGSPDGADGNGHGTHVAGTIAQTTNNALGVAGLAPNAKILPVKVLTDFGIGRSEWIAAGIDEAVDRGADVINLSLGGPTSAVMQNAVKKAIEAGVIVVAAAGNSSREGVGCPANTPGVIAVSATGPDDVLAFYSSYGKEVAISAPGGDKRKAGGGILQDTIEGKGHAFKEFQGTSMASPHVAGAAAVLLSAGAGGPDQVKSLLYGASKDLGAPGWDNKYGHGRLDLQNALQTLVLRERAPLFGIAAAGALLLSLFTGVRVRAVTILAAALAAGGAFFLAWLPLPPSAVTEILSLPILDWPAVLGRVWAGFPLWLSVLAPLVATFVLGATRAFGPLVAGALVGVGAHLVWGGVMGTLHPWGMGASLASGWLVVNGLLTLGLAMATFGVTRIRERKAGGTGGAR